MFLQEARLHAVEVARVCCLDSVVRPYAVYTNAREHQDALPVLQVPVETIFYRVGNPDTHGKDPYTLYHCTRTAVVDMKSRTGLEVGIGEILDDFPGALLDNYGK